MRLRWGPIFFLLPLSAVFASAADDTGVFENNCAACHGMDGSARTPQGRKLKAKDLRASKLADPEIERTIREGSKNKSGTTLMPAFGRDLTDAQIQAAIRTVKSLRTPAAQ